MTDPGEIYACDECVTSRPLAMSLRKYRARRTSRRGQLLAESDGEQQSVGDADVHDPERLDDDSNEDHTDGGLAGTSREATSCRA